MPRMGDDNLGLDSVRDYNVVNDGVYMVMFDTGDDYHINGDDNHGNNGCW